MLSFHHAEHVFLFYVEIANLSIHCDVYYSINENYALVRSESIARKREENPTTFLQMWYTDTQKLKDAWKSISFYFLRREIVSL